MRCLNGPQTCIRHLTRHSVSRINGSKNASRIIHLVQTHSIRTCQRGLSKYHPREEKSIFGKMYPLLPMLSCRIAGVVHSKSLSRNLECDCPNCRSPPILCLRPYKTLSIVVANSALDISGWTPFALFRTIQKTWPSKLAAWQAFSRARMLQSWPAGQRA